MKMKETQKRNAPSKFVKIVRLDRLPKNRTSIEETSVRRAIVCVGEQKIATLHFRNSSDDSPYEIVMEPGCTLASWQRGRIHGYGGTCIVERTRA